MADSFFGFNTSLSAMDEGSCLSDDEYDLLNDETFGLEASQCDWEDQHETFAKIAESKKKPKDDDLDLEASLSNLVLDDCIVPVQSELDDTSVDLDPKVWASPEKPITQQVQLPRTLCTVEEIERGLIRPNIAQHQIPPHHNGIIQNPPPPPGLVRHFGQIQNQQRFPPGLPRHPVPHLPNSGPPGPPMRMLQHPNMRPQLGHTLPAGLIYNSNMNIPPNFNRQDLSQTFPHCALNQHPIYQQKHQQGFQHNAIPNSNMTNQNMVQMIQQNHPLLQNFRNQQYNRMYNNHNNQNQNVSFNSHKNHNSNHGNQNALYNGQFNAHLTNGGEVLDEYSNLMSARDKQWLINIQLMQLNTGTPYIDDYYYTVFTEKQNKIKGERETIAHKDNALNHPLIQPKQNNRFYNQGNNRSLDGQHRERRNSQSRDKENPQQQRTYTPLQFENSLGKLTCGSVTAPRKIIDMEMVSTEKDSVNLTSSEAKKCRQLLMMIESLYRTLLKLEDLSNPMAVATVKLVREREEKQLQQLVEQRTRDPDSSTDVIPTLSKPDDKDELISSLLTSLDKISILSVRKGKILVLRILPHLDILTHHLELLDFYCRMIRNLPQLGRKDQNTDNLLPRFYGHFKTFISHLECEQLISIAESFTDIGEKGMAYCIGNKLGISMISILLLQCELLHQESLGKKANVSAVTVKSIPPAWSAFLACTSNAFCLLGGTMQSPLEFIDRDILYHHLERCPQLRSNTAKLVMFERAFVCLEQREN